MKTFFLFTLSILWLVFSVSAADATPKTITASSSNGSLLWPTNFFSANSNSIWTVLGGGETGVLAIERGGTGTTNAAGLRGVIGLDAGDPGSMGTNWLTLSTAAEGRGVLGLDVATPGELGTNWLMLGTSADGRYVLGLYDWVTNSSKPLDANSKPGMGINGAHSSAVLFDVDVVGGDAGVRFIYGANDYLLKMYGRDLQLVETSDGSTPHYTNAPIASAILNFMSLTNLFVRKTNEVALFPIADTPSLADARIKAAMYGKASTRGEITLHGLTTNEVTGVVFEGEVPLVDTTGKLNITNVVLGTTNVVGAIAGKQATNVVADLTALAVYSGAEDTVFVADTGGTYTRTTGLEADGVIVVTNTGHASVFQRQYTGPADVRWWGAIADDVLDDTSAIQAAADWAVASLWGTNYYYYNQKKIMFPPGTFRISDKVHLLCNVEADPIATRVYCVDGTGTSGGFVFGNDTNYWYFPKASLPTLWYMGSQTNSVGLELKNCVYGQFSGINVMYFNTGVLMRGLNAKGTTFTSLNGGMLFNNTIQLRLLSEDGGWVNDNSIFGISFTAPFTGKNSDAFDVFVGGTKPNNNNRFVHCSFENRSPVYFVYLDGTSQDNYFIKCRYENYESIGVTSYEKAGGLVTLRTAAQTFSDGDVITTGSGILESGIRCLHASATNCTSTSVSYYLGGPETVAYTELTNGTVYRNARVYNATNAKNNIFEDGIFLDWVYLDIQASASGTMQKWNEHVVAESRSRSLGVPPFRGRNYENTLPTYAVYTASGTTNVFLRDARGATNWLAGLASDTLKFRAVSDSTEKASYSGTGVSFGPGNTALDTTLARTDVATLSMDGRLNLNSSGISFAANTNGTVISNGVLIARSPIIESVSDQEAAAIGETELYAADAAPITSTGWTTNGVDWAGFNHASGGGTDPLTLAVGEATGTHTYLLTYKIVGTASGASYAVTASVGNSLAQSPYNGGSVAQTFTEGLLSVSDGNLVFTPVNTFAGYITNISLRRAENSIAPVLALKNSNGDSVIELRSDDSLNNTFLGKDAGSKNITGNSNVAIGSGALENNVSGYWQTAVGTGALKNSISGTRNVAIGISALKALTTGQRNTAVGDMSGKAITTGNWNTLVGKDSGYALTVASNAVAIGFYALGNHKGGYNNIGIGEAAGYGVASSSGHNNIFIGDSAGYDFTSADLCTIVGDGAGINLESGDGNTFIGANSGRYISTGKNNTFVGYYAGHSSTEANERSTIDEYCVLLGSNARRATDRPASTKLTGAVAIGHNAMVGLDYNIVLGGTGSYAASVSVGATNAAPSAVMDLTSTTKGFLMPRMTTAQREAISSPAEGLAVWDLTLHKVFYWDATHWTNGW